MAACWIGVVERVADRLRRQPQLASTGVLGEVGGTNSDDGSSATEQAL
jgi:hypothetical protein